MSAQPRLEPHAAPAAVTGWAVLTLDGLRLALPQRDMVTLELASVLQMNPPGRVEVGRFVQKNRTWSVYALDAALALQTAGVTQRLCAFFKTAGQVRGLLCDTFSLLPQDDDLIAEPQPGCMAQVFSPLDGYVLRENQMVATTSAQRLGAYLEHLLEARHAAAG